MELMIVILVVSILNLVVALGALALSVLNRRGDQPVETEIKLDGPIVELPKHSVQYAVAGRPRPPFPAPTVGGETLKQWMIHRYNVDNIWSRFVDAFYIRAASHHKVRPLFEGKDINEIKRKFLATLLIMCDKGVSEPAAAGLVKLHAHLNMTVDAYDATMDALEVTLVEYQVPEETIKQFVPMIDYFRDEMTVNA